jgi:mannose-6-phosphate isomerase-like protein (cupin superfamily)
MSGFSINIEQKTLEGNNFREVLYTTERSQLVIMTLQPNEEIGMEHHTGHDQFIRVEQGRTWRSSMAKSMRWRTASRS